MTLSSDNLRPEADLRCAMPDSDLHKWGWAPGGYIIRCCSCDRDKFENIGDKRSTRCRACAELLELGYRQGFEAALKQMAAGLEAQS